MIRKNKLSNVAVAVVQRAVLAFCLLLSLSSLFAEQVEFDRESFAYVISRNFSEITWDRADVFSFHSQSNMGANCVWDSPSGDHCRYARGAVIQLHSGDSKRFGTFGAGPSMFHVMITNGCAVIGRTDVPNRFKSARTLVWFCSEVAIGNEDGGIPSITKRNFCVDAEHNDGYDIERKKDFPFRFPFKALWNGYTDLLRKTRDPESVRKVIIGDYMRLFDRAAASPDLRAAGDDLPEGQAAIVCFEDEPKPMEGTNRWRGTYLAEIVRRDTSTVIRAVARFRDGGSRDIVCVDARGRPRLSDCFNPVDSPLYDRHYSEFDGAGNLTRYVCICACKPNPLLYRNGDTLFGTADDDRSARDAFVAEVVSATKPIADAWRNGSFKRVCPSPEPTPEQIAAYRAGQERRKAEREESRRQEERWNAERRKNGLPDLTREEIRKKWNDHFFQMTVRDMATLRLGMNGGAPTTERDLRLDHERAKTLDLYSKVRLYQTLARNVAGHMSFPTNLHQLVGFKTVTGTLLLAGEDELLDGWGREYGYRIERQVLSDGSGREYPVVSSAGEDGVFGTKDDISSLELIRMRNKFKDAADPDSQCQTPLGTSIGTGGGK